MAERSTPTRVRVLVTPGSVAALFTAVVLAIVVRNVLVEARRTIGWAVGSAIVAALIEPLVSLLQRQMRRAVAIALALLVVAAVVIVVVWGLLGDLDHELDRLKEAAPEAAARIEESERFGDLARDIRLAERVTDAVDSLQSPAAGLAGSAPQRVSIFFVCAVLTIFMLVWGPRMAEAGLAQISDPRRRARLRRSVGAAFRRARRYAVGAVLQSVGAGLITWSVTRLTDVPAPTPLALIVAIGALVPYIGILVGCMPALMMSAGFQDFGEAAGLALLFVVLQMGQVLLVQRSVHRGTIYIGPAVIVLSLLLGFDLYGVGGAIYGAALAVFGVALADGLVWEGDDEPAPTPAPDSLSGAPESDPA